MEPCFSGITFFWNWPHFLSDAKNIAEVICIRVSREGEMEERYDQPHFSNGKIEAQIG